MQATYTAKELAQKLGKVQRTILRRATKEEWPYTWETAQGGAVKLFLFHTLPPNIRAAIEADELVPSVQRSQPGGGPDSPALSEAQQSKALVKYDLLRLYLQSLARAGWGKKAEAREEFMHLYNGGVMLKKLYEILGPLSWKTIEGWKRTVKFYNGDAFQLADRRGTAKKGRTKLTEEQMGILRTFALHPNGIKPSHAVEWACKVMKRRGIDTLSRATYTRYINKLEVDDNPLWVFCRKGEQALEYEHGYTIKHNYDKINVGDVLTADGKKLNFNIINPWTGKPCRMTLVLWYDMKSSHPLGWDLMPTEDTWTINSALRRAIITLGKMPLVAYIDNGQAFKAKHFTQTEDLSQEGFAGLYARLGIETTFAWPYHGQSKNVERFFGNMLEMESVLPTYVGNSISNKPARMHRGEKLHNALWERAGGGDIAISMEQAHQMLAAWFDDYVMREQGPDSHIAGQCPRDIFEAGRGPGVDEVELRVLMMSVTVKKTRKTGVRLWKEDYYHPAIYGRRRPVLVRYDMMDRSRIFLYEESGEFLCEARPQARVHPAAKIGTEEDKALLESELALKQHLKKQTVGFARKLLKSNILPEHQRMLELQGIGPGTDGGEQRTKKQKPVLLDEKKLAAQVERMEQDTAEASAVSLNSDLEERQESDRYERLLEMQYSGQLVAKRWRSWMSYFEETPEYGKDQEYWESRRTAFAIMYQVGAGQ